MIAHCQTVNQSTCKCSECMSGYTLKNGACIDENGPNVHQPITYACFLAPQGVENICDISNKPSRSMYEAQGCAAVSCEKNCWSCSSCLSGWTYDSISRTCSRNEEPELPDINDPPCPNAPKFYSTNNACVAECSHELCHRCKSTGAHPMTKYYCNDGSALCRVAHCAICSVSSAYECELCSSGYVLDGGLCVDEPVNPGCEDAFCLKCKAGYKRVNNDCVPCEPGTYQEESNFTGSSCKPCQNGATTKEYATTYCPMCMIVYPLDHYGMCTQCDENICKAGVCQGEEGTVWDDTVHNCVPVVCSSHCTACTSSASCTTCEEGYVLQGGSCVKAQARCQDPYVVSDDGCCCVKQEIVNRERP